MRYGATLDSLMLRGGLRVLDVLGDVVLVAAPELEAGIVLRSQPAEAQQGGQLHAHLALLSCGPLAHANQHAARGGRQHLADPLDEHVLQVLASERLVHLGHHDVQHVGHRTALVGRGVILERSSVGRNVLDHLANVAVMVLPIAASHVAQPLVASRSAGREGPPGIAHPAGITRIPLEASQHVRQLLAGRVEGLDQTARGV
mmetsp:Transcript_57891/g.124377  ORF Transcript_57891/g.124377 Transcript_57891/m.124377 type:complete len:202 (+) Transcript_57891:15-620(+)